MNQVIFFIDFNLVTIKYVQGVQKNRSRSDTSLKTSKFMNSPYNQMARRCLFCHKQSEEPRKKYLNGQL